MCVRTERYRIKRSVPFVHCVSAKLRCQLLQYNYSVHTMLPLMEGDETGRADCGVQRTRHRPIPRNHQIKLPSWAFSGQALALDRAAAASFRIEPRQLLSGLIVDDQLLYLLCIYIYPSGTSGTSGTSGHLWQLCAYQSWREAGGGGGSLRTSRNQPALFSSSQPSFFPSCRR